MVGRPLARATGRSSDWRASFSSGAWGCRPPRSHSSVTASSVASTSRIQRSRPLALGDSGWGGMAGLAARWALWQPLLAFAIGAMGARRGSRGDP